MPAMHCSLLRLLRILPASPAAELQARYFSGRLIEVTRDVILTLALGLIFRPMLARMDLRLEWHRRSVAGQSSSSLPECKLSHPD
jgi:hypothetical protein